MHEDVWFRVMRTQCVTVRLHPLFTFGTHNSQLGSCWDWRFEFCSFANPGDAIDSLHWLLYVQLQGVQLRYSIPCIY